MTHADPRPPAALAEMLVRWRSEPGVAALRARGQVWSRRALACRAAAFAAHVQGEVSADADARVLVLADPGPGHAIALLASLAAGWMHVPVNPRYGSIELEHALARADPVAIVVDDVAREVFARSGTLDLTACGCPVIDAPRGDEHVVEDAAAFEQYCARVRTHDESAAALMIFTSGTTGASKGVVSDRSAVWDCARTLARSWGVGPADRLVLSLPWFHVHGLCVGLVGALASGAEVDVLERFDPRAVVESFAAGATIMYGVPTMYERLVAYLREHPNAAATLARARLFVSGSAALSQADREAFAALTGHVLLERYGMTETQITLSQPLSGPRPAGTVGLPLPGVRTRVVDDEAREVAPGQAGALWIQGPGVMREYFREPEATAATFREGWFVTGDVVEIGAEGHFRVVGRASTDILKTGGFKVATGEIEAHLREHPAVAEVSVVGVADPTWGEIVCAIVIARDPAVTSASPSAGTAAAFLEALAAHCEGALADYKRPRALAVVDALPRNALGKVQKQVLRAAIEAGALPVARR